MIMMWCDVKERRQCFYDCDVANTGKQLTLITVRVFFQLAIIIFSATSWILITEKKRTLFISWLACSFWAGISLRILVWWWWWCVNPQLPLPKTFEDSILLINYFLGPVLPFMDPFHSWLWMTRAFLLLWTYCPFQGSKWAPSLVVGQMKNVRPPLHKVFSFCFEARRHARQKERWHRLLQ